MSVVELVSGTRVRLLIDSSGPESTDQMVPAAVVLSSLPKKRLEEVRERAAHIREVLTGYRSGNSEIAEAGEPRAEFDHSRPLCDRYAAKAAELGVDERTIRRWVKAYEENGEAGLVPARFALQNRIDPRWSEAALAIMREHTQESKPSEKAVIYQTSKRLEICFGHGVVPEPSQATAYRELKRLEAPTPRHCPIRRQPTNQQTGLCLGNVTTSTANPDTEPSRSPLGHSAFLEPMHSPGTTEYTRSNIESTDTRARRCSWRCCDVCLSSALSEVSSATERGLSFATSA
jgi:transposase-like protein